MVVKSDKLIFSLPSTVSQLKLRRALDIKFSRLPNLKQLYVDFPIPFDNLPPNITHLSIAEFNETQIITALPPSITHLSCSFSISCNLPPNIVYFCTGKFRAHLPPSLKYLSFSDTDHCSITHLTNLTHFSTLCESDKPLQTLPPFITHLTLLGSFNGTIESIPSTLTHIYFGNNFNQPLGFLSPTNVQYVRLGLYFNQSLLPLPDSVLLLDLMACRKLVVDKFPKSLKYLAWDKPILAPAHVRVISTRLSLAVLMPPIDSFTSSWSDPSSYFTFGCESGMLSAQSLLFA